MTNVLSDLRLEFDTSYDCDKVANIQHEHMVPSTLPPDAKIYTSWAVRKNTRN